MFLNILFFSGLIALFLLAFEKDHFLERYNHYWFIDCRPCRAFWFSVIIMVFVFLCTFDFNYLKMVFIIPCISIVFLKFLQK